MDFSDAKYLQFGYVCYAEETQARRRRQARLIVSSGPIDVSEPEPEACSISLVQLLTPQFMSSSEDGIPDLPSLTISEELECISCSTRGENTNGQDSCVTAKTKSTTMCPTMAW